LRLPWRRLKRALSAFGNNKLSPPRRSIAEKERIAMEYYHAFDFLVKGKNPDVQRWTFHTIKDLDNSFHDRAVLKPDKSFFGEEELKDYLEIVRWGYENFNRYFLMHHLKPVFDTSDLAACIEKRKWLARFGTEKEIAKMFGVASAKDYKPEVFENDLICAATLIFPFGSRYYTLLTERYDREKCLEMGLAKSDEEAVNLHLARYGRAPLFPCPEDEEATKNRHRELFRLRPRAECEAYLDEVYPDWRITDPSVKYRFGIEAYSYNAWGYDGGGTCYAYTIGWSLRYIADRVKGDEDIKNYAKSVNNLCSYKVFGDEDVDTLVERARELMRLYPAESIVEVKKY